jgi:hypothetical protein
LKANARHCHESFGEKIMNVSPKRQHGITFLGLIFVLGFIVIVVLLVLRIAPIYLDHRKVASALTEIENTADIQQKSPAEIRESLNKRFNINYVYDVTQDDVTIIKYGNYLKVAIEYEVVRKIVGNLSVLVEFNDVIEVGQK